MRERQALILCDGRRDLAELGTLLGPGTPAQIERLCAAGYLTMTGAPIVPANAQTIEAVRPIPQIVAPAQPPSPATSSRRSIIAAKLYMVGMLELQAHESAASHRTRLQACKDPDATAAHILAAMHCLQRTTSNSFTQRVRERLAEVMPEPYLPALEKIDLALASAVSQ